VLEFEEPIGIIEEFERSSDLRGYNRREHDSILIRGCLMIQTEPEDIERIRERIRKMQATFLWAQW
jgi:hypothetical protein